MTLRMSGVLAVVVLALAAPASAEAQSAPAQPSGIVVAQASPESATPARRSRKHSATSKKEPTAGQMAARERQKKCSAEWQSAKAAGKVESGMKWPKFWSQCNARLKGNSA
jgi:hypothetical protein